MKIRNLLLVLAAAAAAALAPRPAAAESFTQGQVKVTVTRAPEKRLDFEVVVPATRAQVWEAFTTESGMRAWVAPEDRVELALGGEWTVGFKGAKPGGGTVLAWLPEEMLSLHAMAPEWFPHVREQRTIAVFRFESAGENQTRVRLAQFGWQNGEEWDKAFDYLSKGNAELLNGLYRRFVEGPVDWTKAAAHVDKPKPASK
jgi:uncharacterized protein YndB with AHSA1/START domain